MPRQPLEDDPLSQFPTELVQPPTTNEVDAVSGEGRSAEAHRPAEGSLRGPPRRRWRLAPPALMQPVILRRLVPALVALGLSAAAVAWGLRIWAPSSVVPEDSRRSVRVEQPADVAPGPSAKPIVPPATGTIGTQAPPTALAKGRQRVAVKRSASNHAARSAPVAGPSPGASKPAPVLPFSEDTAVAVSESPAAPVTPVPLEILVPRDLGPSVRVPEPLIAVADEEAVRQTLQHYAQAYGEMDVLATARVWPSVDRRALAHAFTTIKSQGLTFENCRVSLAESSATARCRGTVQFVRRVGNPVPLTALQEWMFRMRKLGNDWIIEELTASQD